MPAVEYCAGTRPGLPGTNEPQERAAAAFLDLRFRNLVGERAWSDLPPAVRRRFSKRLRPGETALYRGEVTQTELAFAGQLLSLLARLIGAPLPLQNAATGPAVVVVSEDDRLGGQSWTRLYARPGRAPQAIHSAKRFSGPTGLEEYVGYGIGMALTVSVEERSLVFRSAHYFLTLGRWRWRLPRALEPGRMEIIHREEAGETFSFRLRLRHPLLGVIVHQLAFFADV
jgi:hypothetical protein